MTDSVQNNATSSQKSRSSALPDEPIGEEQTIGPIDQEKNKDRNLFLGFYKFVKPYNKFVAYAIFTIPFSVAASLLVPWFTIEIVDNYLLKNNTQGFWLFSMYMILTVLVGLLADSLYSYNLQKTGNFAITDMRKALFDHVLQLPRAFFDKTPIGTVLTRLTADMEALGESLAVGVLSLVSDVLKIIGLFCFLLYISWQLSMIIFVILPLIYFIGNILKRRLRVYFNLSRAITAESVSYLQECLNGVKTVQLYTAEEKVYDKYSDTNYRFYKSQAKANLFESLLFAVMESITTISIAAMILYGGYLLINQGTTIGVIVAFIHTLQRIFVPIREFVQQISVIQRSLAALEHINTLFETKIEEKKVLLPRRQKNLAKFETLEFKGVKFKYSEDGPYILKGISFKLKKNDRIAIVGPTGSGKSTIIKLISKIYDDYEGSIKINGVEISQISKDDLFHIFALMQQDVHLFNESIKFNIALNREGLDDQKIMHASKYVFAHDFISLLPNGYETKIIENGTNLSQGQAQLVSFARALAFDSDLIILDEATSNIDSHTEHLIQNAIEKLLEEKTVIAIAHRLSTIEHSDSILVIKDGSIFEQGSHKELIKHGGLYAGLIKQIEQAA